MAKQRARSRSPQARDHKSTLPGVRKRFKAPPAKAHQRVISRTSSEREQGTHKFEIDQRHDDLFDAPARVVLVHACNCQGSWGKGIALAFKQKHPVAFTKYNRHCKRNPPVSLRGTALLIPPQPEDGHDQYIGCLFTSARAGVFKDSPALILESTRTAMKDLTRQITEVAKNEAIGDIWMPKINSGLFRVDWQDTLNVLQGLRFNNTVPKIVVTTK